MLFLTGTDEHGLKIEQKAAEKGVTPKAYVDEIVAIFKKLWSYMNISYDRYIRTTDDYHIETVQKIFKELYGGLFTRASTKANTAPPARAFGRKASWWTASVRNAAVRSPRPLRKPISLSCPPLPTGSKSCY